MLLFKFILYTIVSSTLIFPQKKYTVSEDVNNFFNLLEASIQKENGQIQYKGISNDAEIKRITELYYQAITGDPIGFKLTLKKKFNRYENLRKENTNLLKPGVQLRLLEEVMSEKYGSNFINIISVPYYLKIKVDSISNVTYHSYEDSELTAGQTVFICKIEDVIKGKNSFRTGDKISINYLSHWRGYYGSIMKVGKEYFVAVRIWRLDASNNPEYTFRYWNNQNVGAYPIDDNSIQFPNDFFGVSGKQNWEEFKDNFQSQYMKIN
jgi:hypothetical protein